MPLRRRHFSALFITLPLPALAQGEAPDSLLLSAAQVRMGVERLAKLQLERALLPQRAAVETDKERQRVSAALRALREPAAKQLQGLSGRRQSQLAQVADDAAAFASAPPGAVAQLVSDSEALAARLGFVTTALSGLDPNTARAAQIDLLARAGATALRVGKLNFAALQQGPSQQLRVGASQSLLEFASALEAIGAQSLSGQQVQALELARHQWLLFRAALDADGLLKGRERLADVATTTDRIAESLAAMARRA